MKILVVGQGLAGTVLCSYLIKYHIPFAVVDNNHFAASTHAAAGIINPITGRLYVKSWMIESLLAESRNCYSFIENLLGKNYVKETLVLRCLRTAEQINKWNESTSRDGYESFLEDESYPNPYDRILKQVSKIGIIKNAMQVDVSRLISDFADYLNRKKILISEAFNHEELSKKDGHWEYRQSLYSHVIFCEGFQVLNNPFFKNVPLQAAKGESLEIEIDDFNANEILRDEIFLVPLGNGKFWSGGSYIWKYQDHQPTTTWKEEWVKNLDEMLQTNCRILNHKAGIRPCVKGRKPLVGEHKTEHGIYLFNGMGTKGTSLSPYWARHLICDHLLDKKEIDPNVDVNRFEY